VTKYLIRRGLQAVGLLFVTMLICFSILRLSPGSPFLELTLGGMSMEQVRKLEEAAGLHDPIPVQFGRWAWRILQLDFGKGVRNGFPIFPQIANALANSFWLVAAGTLLGMLGIPLGMHAAQRRGKRTDYILRGTAVFLSAVPMWWVGLIIIGFMKQIETWRLVDKMPIPQIFPVPRDPTFWIRGTLWERVWFLLLPSLLLALFFIPVYLRYVRSQTLEVLSQDYVRTAHAKGLSQPRISRRHVLRNSLTPLITVWSSLLPTLFALSLTLESAVSFPGLGQLFLTGVRGRDYNLMMGILLVLGFLIILGNLLADLAYAWLDPRIRLK
jgi:peptide/nickel transport system permease protein